MLKKYLFFTFAILSTANPMEHSRYRQRLSDTAPSSYEVNPTSLYTDSLRLTDEEVNQALAQCPAEIMDIFNCYTENQRGEIKGALDSKFHNVLMFDGPSGTGKSTLARAFAQRAGVPFTFVRCVALKHSGSTNVASIFGQILEKQEPHVLIMDEIQSLLRGQDSNLLTMVRSQLDTCYKRKEFMIIFTGNDYEILPPQLKSRIYHFGFKLPTFDERESLIRFILNSKYQNCHNLSDHAINQIAKKTADFSIRDMEQMFKQSVLNCRMRVENSPREINVEDIQKAIGLIKQDERFLPWYRTLGASLRPVLVPTLLIGIPLIGGIMLQHVLHRARLTQARELHNERLLQLQREFHEQILMTYALRASIKSLSD